MSEITPGIWMHFKGGEYEVYSVTHPGNTDEAAYIGTAVHSEDRRPVRVYIVLALPFPRFITGESEPMVLYRPTYGERLLTVRPLSMWSDHIEREGYSGPRFTLKEQTR